MEKTTTKTSEANTPANATPNPPSSASLTHGAASGAVATGPDRANLNHGSGATTVTPLDPVAERINAAYIRCMAASIDAVKAAIEAGVLLQEQQEKMPGKWEKWVEENCPKISLRTAYKLVRTAAYVKATGYFEAQTVRQLYLEAGVIKAGDGQGDGDADPSPSKSVLLPAMTVFKKLRLYYTDDRLNELQPVAVPQLLGYVRDIQGELHDLEAKLVKRMPPAGKVEQ